MKSHPLTYCTLAFMLRHMRLGRTFDEAAAKAGITTEQARKLFTLAHLSH